MVSSRLKDIIFKKLYSDLSRVEIIHYKTYIWFIDREDKCWYFRYDKSDGTLLWKYSFFSNFFALFTMCDSEFTPILSSWVEEVLNCKVNTTLEPFGYYEYEVEEAQNCKVNTTDIGTFSNSYMVEEVLNCKVNTTLSLPFLSTHLVEEALNCKVNTTVSADVSVITLMEDVLNYRVNTTTIKYGRFPISVKEVLNCKVTTTINKTPIEVRVVEEVAGLNHNV